MSIPAKSTRRSATAFFLLVTLALFVSAPRGAQCQDVLQEYTRTSVEELVEVLRRKQIRVHFIEPSYTPDQAMTLVNRIAELEAIAADRRTEKEGSMLQFLQKIARPGAVQYIGFDYARFDVQFDPKSLLDPDLPQKLLSLCQGDESYAMVDLTTSFLFVPKNDAQMLEKGSLKISGAPPADALKIFQEFLQENKLGFADIGFSDRYLPTVEGPISLDLNDEPLPVIMTRFAEAMAGDLVWTIGGQKGFRQFQFRQLK